jgi:hypothetical protein
MLSLIGTLFVGIFGLFDKVFGKKKYAVEFKDTEETTAKAPAPESAPAPAPAPAVPAATTETASKSKKTSVKKNKSGQAPKAEPVKATVEAAQPVAPKKVELKTFAPDYLVPTSTGGRRFGGPSLNSFREMARQMPVKK